MSPGGHHGLLHSRCECHHLGAHHELTIFILHEAQHFTQAWNFPPVHSHWQILMGRNCHIPKWRLIKKTDGLNIPFLFLSFAFLDSSGILAVPNEESEIGQGRKEVRA